MKEAKPTMIIPANDHHRHLVIALLVEEKLPVSDLPDPLDNFIVAVEGREVIGAVGMEKYEHFGLLRSLVVHKQYRNQNIASSLVNALEHYARSAGIGSIYLLTETAPRYFERRGYRIIKREEVPAAVQASSEFSHVCPQSAIVMNKKI